MTFYEALAYVLAFGLVLIIVRIFIKPLKTVFKLTLSSALGGTFLYIFNLFGTKIGFTIGVNIVTASVCGLLGIPGFVSLSALKLILGI